ncbi:hypothetical protein G4V62_12740 [Bacillaceae bacterium SIJ1]|nr:hypothetical protein [Litoribacterium kuwaitense]
MMNQLQQPLVEALEMHSAKNPTSFHVPGHKNGALLGSLPQSLRSSLRYDMTEISGLDDLHAPTGVIQDAQALLTDFFRTRQSFFLVGGSTAGNLAMILACCSPGI